MRVGESFCPGVLHAVPAKDGMLIRIRVPGGLLHPRQLAAVAALACEIAAGQIEITSRANLQLRAIQPHHLPQAAAALSSAGLLPSSQHDRVRNIVTSPFAGLAPDELFDPRPFLAQLDQRLIADPAFLGLHPKFSFALNGGGGGFHHETDDLALQAITPHTAQLLIAGRDTGHAVDLLQAVDCLLQAATCCIQLARQLGTPVRAKHIAANSAALQTLLHSLSPLLQPSPRATAAQSVEATPLGIYPQRSANQVSVIPSIPLGRLTSDQATRIAATAADTHADLRLTPWRGILLGSVPQPLVAQAIAQLASVALFCDARDGFHGLAACAGSTGCDASLADVRADAVLLAHQLAGPSQPSNWTVNLSGCDKRCAMRHAATAELVATPSGYTLRLHGQLSGTLHSPESARQAILSAHAKTAPNLTFEEAS